MSNVLVTIYDSAGLPKADATPTFVAVRSTTGSLVTSPIITNIGYGNYEFELEGNTGYLIATGANPMYVAGGVGSGVWSALYASDGTPKSDASPTVQVFSWTGTPLGSQAITNCGAGLYWFSFTSAAIFKMATGCLPAYYDGTIDIGVPEEIVVPPIGVQEPVDNGWRQWKMNLSSGLPVLDSMGRRIRLNRPESLAQALWIRCARFRNEWKFDLDSGLPYNDWNETPNPNLTVIRQTVYDELLKVNDVASIDELQVTLESGNLRIVGSVKCSDGTTVTLGV